MVVVDKKPDPPKLIKPEIASPLTYRCLGTIDGKYFYYSFLLQKCVAYSPLEHRKENLFNLAPLSHWKAEYGDTKGGVHWDQAVDSLMQTCAAEGLFNPLNIIGRGIWIIEGKAVTHYGNKILIDGQAKLPKEIAGKQVYEVAESLRLGEPDTAADMGQIQAMLSELHFQTPDAPLFISGWLVCAMAAGCLHWRPHGWVTGKTGTGKSAVIKLMKQILGNCTEFYVGETTEAGIRQDLKHDCRAILFDEAEPKTPAAMVKIQAVLNLLRQASSDDTGKIAKGTTTGKGITFKIRSCGFLGSINANLVESADKNRFFVIEMSTPLEKELYDLWCFRMENTFNNGFQSALHARISANALTLRDNAKVFSRVLAARFKDNRAGDQYGTLMAGAYLLSSLERISADDAADWCKDVQFPIENKMDDIENDEKWLWEYILTRRIQMKKQNGNSYITLDKPIAELLDAATGSVYQEYAKEDAVNILAYHGLKMVFSENKWYAAVSTNHAAIGDLINKTRFAGLKWSHILRRLPEALTPEKTERFGQHVSAVTLIPF